MDCRLPRTKHGLLMGYMVLQSRKRHVDIYYTTQDFDLVDYKRLVKYTSVIVYCQKVFVKNRFGEFEEVENWRNFTIIDLRKKNDNVVSFNLNIEPFYKYYDTDYIIEPILDFIIEK